MNANVLPPASKISVCKTWRVAKSALPFVGIVAAGTLAYCISPDLRNHVNWVRSELNLYPLAAEMISSGFTLGFLPDFIAQKYEGTNFNFRRSAGMTVLGAITGGVVARKFYDFQEKLFPGGGFWNTFKKILVDQGNYTPAYLFSYLTCVNLIKGENLFRGIWTNMVKILPANWFYWGALALPILYNLPQDLKIYALQFFAITWFSYQSKVVYAPETEIRKD